LIDHLFRHFVTLTFPWSCFQWGLIRDSYKHSLIISCQLNFKLLSLQFHQSNKPFFITLFLCLREAQSSRWGASQQMTFTPGISGTQPTFSESLQASQAHSQPFQSHSTHPITVHTWISLSAHSSINSSFGLSNS
jgi:hypothetical protein